MLYSKGKSKGKEREKEKEKDAAAAAGVFRGTSSSNQKKTKLRTSEDVYDRILWDAVAFAKEDFIIGYTDRFRGLMEVAFPDFTPGGDIPYHRIYYFRNSEGFVWDRETRFDLIFHSGEVTGQDSQENVTFRENQMLQALKATAEAEEEKREMADQKARRKLARARQFARRNNHASSDTSGKWSFFIRAS